MSMFWIICWDISSHIFGVCDCVHEAVTWEAHFNTSAINANFTAAFLSTDNCIIFHEFYFIAEWRRIDHESSIVAVYSVNSIQHPQQSTYRFNDFIKTKKDYPCPKINW